MVWSIQLLDMGVTHHLEYERIMGIIVVGAWVYFLSLGSITYKHILEFEGIFITFTFMLRLKATFKKELTYFFWTALIIIFMSLSKVTW